MSEDTIYTNPGKPTNPWEQVEGSIIYYGIEWEGVTSSAVSSVTVYREEEDVTSSVMTSGTNSDSGNITSLKPITALTTDGGLYYVVVVKAVLDAGDTDVRKMLIKIISDETED